MSKTIFILGMGNGISTGVAERFAKEGFKPVMFSRNGNNLETISDKFSKKGIDSSYYTIDLSDNESINSVLAKAIDSEGTPEVFVYNAASLRKKNILEDDFNSLVNDYKVNVAGAVISSGIVIKKMLEVKKGTVIFTGGGLSMYPSHEYGSLSIGKAGIKNLTQSIAQAVDHSDLIIGTVTVSGFVSEEDKMYNPRSIAEQYWKIHSTGENGHDIDY